MKIIYLIIFSTLCSLQANAQSSKKMRFDDMSYEEEIRTVLLYPGSAEEWNTLGPAVAQLGKMDLLLEFDDLVEQPETYNVKIIHCNKNWTKSRLSDIDFLYDYNELRINNYQFSANTKIAYIHYTFNLPRVKLPGNYLLVAYRGTDQSDIILTKRFMVFSKNITIEPTSLLRGLTSNNRNNQQIDFKVIYENYELTSPIETVDVVIRQNQRWDNIITGLKPNFIREDIHELEYRFFDYQNNFAAGNEFRFFDARSLRYPGRNVETVDWSTYPITVNLMSDKTREYEVYGQNPDINGGFIVSNTDTGQGKVYGDYVTTKFTLLSDEPVAGKVYVIGKMNDWKRSSDSQLEYSKATKSYHGELILKQGRYDYQYYVANDTLSGNFIEANHFETENEYEIFVYYRPLTSRADLLIGYGRYTLNKRD